MNTLRGLPEDEWEQLTQALELFDSLSTQASDRQLKRNHQDDINQIVISPVIDPLDMLLKTMQDEIKRLREDNNLLTNTIRAYTEAVKANQRVLDAMRTVFTNELTKHQKAIQNIEKPRPKKK